MDHVGLSKLEEEMICQPEALQELYTGNTDLQNILIAPARSYIYRSFYKFFNKVDVILLFTAHLQVLLNRLLTNYLNGEDIVASRLHYFTHRNVIYRISEDVIVECLYCLEVLKKMSVVSFSDFPKDLTVRHLNMNYEDKMPTFLSNSYRILEKITEKLGETSKQNSLYFKRYFDASNYDGLILEALLKLKGHSLRHLTNYFSSLYLIGSLSSLDFSPGLSDMDTLLIIKRNTLFKPKILKRARNAVLSSLPFFYWVDPLQHHGHLVISEVDLKWYPQTFFPLALLEEGIPLEGSAKSLQYSDRDCRFERFGKAWIGTSNFMENNKKVDRWKDPYQLKMHLQVAQLLPVLLNQVLGIYLGKPEAFSNLKPHYSKNAWQLLEQSTRMRLAGGFDPIACKMIYKNLVTGRNPRSLHRRARRLGDAKKYLKLVRRYMGNFEKIQRLGQLFAEESFDWLKGIHNTLS
jgi:hypothetical protein